MVRRFRRLVAVVQHGFGQIHLSGGPNRDSPAGQLPGELTVVVSQAPIHHEALSLQGCELLHCRLDSVEGQGGVDDVTQQDEALGTIGFEQ